jgi:hypothetical protein
MSRELRDSNLKLPDKLAAYFLFLISYFLTNLPQ